MIGERITDGETEATLSYLLNANDHPALYIGKSDEDLTEVTVDLYTEELTILQEFDSPQDLVGKIVYIKDFYVEKPIEQFKKFDFIDSDYYFSIETEDFVDKVDIEVLDPGESVLPPSLYDINTLPKVIDAPDSTYIIKGTYNFKKDKYHPFFGKQYLTADLVADEVQTASYAIMPMTILGVDIIPESSSLVLKCAVVSELKMYSTPPGNNTLILLTTVSRSLVLMSMTVSTTTH